MEQEVRFCELAGRRIAYATVGEGPLLLFGGRWVTHLEEEWANPASRSFFEDLARTHRVVRYDRLGTGLSDRRLAEPLTAEAETRMLAAVHEAVGAEPAILFACSCAGLASTRYAVESPERVRKIVYYGAYAARDDIPEATRRSLVDFARVNWQLAAQMLAGLFMPHAERRRDRRVQPLSAPLGGCGRRRGVHRARPRLRRPGASPAGRDAGARAASPRRSHGADRPGSRARLAPPERTLRRVERRRASALARGPARAPASARGLPRGRAGPSRRTATLR